MCMSYIHDFDNFLRVWYILGMIVMKFGGASLSNTENINNVCQIVKEYLLQNKVILVVSATKGTTDKLIKISEYLTNGEKGKALNLAEKIGNDHRELLQNIGNTANTIQTEHKLEILLSGLQKFISHFNNEVIMLDQSDFIISLGERLSCLLVSLALQTNNIASQPIDTSKLLATNDKFGRASILSKNKQTKLTQTLLPLIAKDILLVVSGFIGFAPDGRITTLGRGGSDLTAAYLAAFLNAKKLYLWKDVDGFYTDDPNKNNCAQLLHKISYEKAEKMAKNGAKILYHKAVNHVEKNNIPIHIKSFLSPTVAGTIISK